MSNAQYIMRNFFVVLFGGKEYSLYFCIQALVLRLQVCELTACFLLLKIFFYNLLKNRVLFYYNPLIFLLSSYYLLTIFLLSFYYPFTIFLLSSYYLLTIFLLSSYYPFTISALSWFYLGFISWYEQQISSKIRGSPQGRVHSSQCRSLISLFSLLITLYSLLIKN